MSLPALTWKCFKGPDQDGVAWTLHHIFEGTIEEVYANCQDRSVADYPDGDYIYQPKTFWDVGFWSGNDLVPYETNWAGTAHQVADHMAALVEATGMLYSSTGILDAAP